MKITENDIMAISFNFFIYSVGEQCMFNKRTPDFNSAIVVFRCLKINHSETEHNLHFKTWRNLEAFVIKFFISGYLQVFSEPRCSQ